MREVRGDDAMIFILGNKVDRESDRVVKKADAEIKIHQMGFEYFEVSAKLGNGVK